MDAYELEIEQNAAIESLNVILNTYASDERKSKKTLIFIVFACAIGIYFTFYDLLGGIGGYILTIAILSVGAYCLNASGAFSNLVSPSNRKLAYQACITMEMLIAIKQGTYRQYGAHILTTSSGRHNDLYKQFIEFYPEYASKELDKLSKIKVEQSDIFN